MTDSTPPEDTDPSARKDSARSLTDHLDVRGMIREASRRVSVDDLVRQGRKTISVLSKEKIEEMVNQAVKTIVAKYRALAAGVVSEEQIEKESQEEFKELYQQYQETNKAKQTLEQTASSMTVEIEDLKKELDAQKRIAEGKLSEEAEKLLIVGFKDFEHELNRIAAKVWEKRRMMLEGEGISPEAMAEWKQIEEKLGGMIQRLVEQHRDLFFSGSGARDRYVVLLEKRLEKMYTQLKAMEEALRAISSQKLLTNQGVQNLLRGLGLLEDDKYAEKRKGMLKIVLQQNVQLRKDLEELESKRTSGTPEPAAATPVASGDGASTAM